MASCMEICARRKHHQIHFWLLIVLYELVIWEGVHSWNYNHSTTDMSWPAARNYCQEYFTDLVAIQNSEENNYLNTVLPRSQNYYWIGIRKIHDVWTWVGTNKSLHKEAENWAEGEPTDGAEDCVEIYIKRLKEAGKWNNDPCQERWKRALCYLASCKPTSCSDHGECVETIGNYTCRCNEGFYGSECESVVKCGSLEISGQRFKNCSHPIGDFSYSSTCDFSCAEGFELRGSDRLECGASGEWSAPIPNCEAVKCGSLEIPGQRFKNCSHPIGDFSYNSTCDFSCAKGFELRGSDRLKCGATGEWSAPIPNCEAVKCDVPKISRNGNMNCSHPMGNFSYNSTCDFGCVEGFSLNGSVNLQCEGSGTWSAPIPACEGTQQEQYKSTEVILIAAAVSAGLISVTFVIWIIKHYRKKVMQRRFSPVRS
ncbi:P-selectin-like [Heptranchias perlo]|uniref:P-selectin-like n=1 Tax=Heptranchias perlo TaxID=212740 RepID=UPI00355948A0